MPTSSSFCEVDKDNVLLVTVKRAEDGNGFIVRLLETEGRDTEVSVSLPFVQVTAAYETNLVEENERIIPVKGKSVGVKINAWGNATLRLIT